MHVTIAEERDIGKRTADARPKAYRVKKLSLKEKGKRRRIKRTREQYPQ